jgi:hypothetical protein
MRASCRASGEKPRRGSTSHRNDGANGTSHRAPISSRRALAVLALAYLAGAFGIAITPGGRARRGWLTTGIISATCCVVIVTATLTGRLEEADNPWVVPLFPLVTLVMFTIAGVVWARAVSLALDAHQWQRACQPPFLRHPLSVGILCFLLPGVGHGLHRRRRRAAGAIVSLGPLVGSVIVLSQAGRLWSLSQASEPPVINVSSLEMIILTACAIAFMGAVLWLLQALDGVRDATSSATARGSQTGGFALALLMALAAFAILFQPEHLAVELDVAAARLHQAGFKQAPWLLMEGASRLDPGQPLYALRRADLCEVAGHHDDAARIRRELHERWSDYAHAVGLPRSSREWPTAAGE